MWDQKCPYLTTWDWDSKINNLYWNCFNYITFCCFNCPPKNFITLHIHIHLSIHFHPSVWARHPHYPLPRPFLLLLREDPQAFPGQPSDIVTPACPGSSSGSPPGGACQEHLLEKASRGHLIQMPPERHLSWLLSMWRSSGGGLETVSIIGLGADRQTLVTLTRYKAANIEN